MHTLLARLVAHVRWADARTAASLRALPDPPAEALRLFAHVARAEGVHLSRIRGEDPLPQDFWPALSLDEAVAEAATAADGFEALLADETHDLSRLAHYRNSSGRTFDTPVWEIVTHVATHGEHHRGQIARIVREAGGEPALTDFLAFVREHPSPSH